jgi:LPXTG-motif cell wall-anchored protein
MRTTRTTRALLAALVGVATLVLLAPAAGAQDYPGGASITLNTPTVGQGGSVTATATGFQPGSDVTFTLASDPITLGTVKANDSGVASITFTVPSNFATGAHTVTATGIAPDGSPLSVSTTLMVTAAGTTPAPVTPAPGTGQLPRTGSDNTLLIQSGVILLAVGGMLAVAARKRSRKVHADA